MDFIERLSGMGGTRTAGRPYAKLFDLSNLSAAVQQHLMQV